MDSQGRVVAVFPLLVSEDFDKHRLKPPVGVLPFMPQPRRGHLFGVADHGFVTVRASVFHPGPQVSAGIGSIRSRP